MPAAGLPMLLLLLLLLLASSSRSRSPSVPAPLDCGTVILNLYPCLDFTAGNATTPGKNCCDALAGIVSSAPVCLCQLFIPDNAGVVNLTKAVELPSLCNVQTPPASECAAAGVPVPGFALAPESPNATASPPPRAKSPTIAPSTASPSSAPKLSRSAARPPAAQVVGGGGTASSKVAIIGIIIGVVAFSIFLAASWKLRKYCNDSSNQGDGAWEAPQGLQRFTYTEIEKATKGFSKDSEIGQGSFGKVYLAHSKDGKATAIKRAANRGSQGTKEFHNEVALLSRLHHRHLVRLEGFCDARGEQILVYEYMKNGNLHHHLFDETFASSLNWYRRLEIAIGVARGLDYLHSFADPPIIHRCETK